MRAFLIIAAAFLFLAGCNDTIDENKESKELKEMKSSCGLFIVIETTRNLLAPIVVVLIKEIHQLDGLTEIYMYLAEITAQHGQGLHQPANGFLLFFLAVQLADIRSGFNNLFIADIHRHKGNRLAGVAQEAA